MEVDEMFYIISVQTSILISIFVWYKLIKHVIISIIFLDIQIVDSALYDFYKLFAAPFGELVPAAPEEIQDCLVLIYEEIHPCVIACTCCVCVCE